jgi:hypothetical protein
MDRCFERGIVDNLAAIASAVAATLAAVFAGVNLYLSGRRDRVRWVRESAADSFVEFLTASYDHRTACKRLIQEPVLGAERAGLVDRALAADDQMLKCLSRLRMLTTPDAVDAAIGLHRHNNAYFALATGAPTVAPTRIPPIPTPDLATTNTGFRVARDHLVTAAKRALSLL